MKTQTREKAINAPVAVLLIAAALVGLFGLQSQIVGVDAWNARFGLRAEDLGDGRAWTLLSYMGAHASWAHVGMNAVGVLAFGAPLARRLGSGIGGLAAYVAYFLMGGALSGLIYLAINPTPGAILVGASGAVFGLIGAATRLMNPWHRLEALWSRRVLTMTAAWVGTNLLIAFLRADPATGTRGVAWEAHLIGLALGLGTVGIWLRLFAPRMRAAVPPTPSGGLEPENQSGPNGGPWG